MNKVNKTVLNLQIKFLVLKNLNLKKFLNLKNNQNLKKNLKLKNLNLKDRKLKKIIQFKMKKI